MTTVRHFEFPKFFYTISTILNVSLSTFVVLFVLYGTHRLTVWCYWSFYSATFVDFHSIATPVKEK